MRGIKHPLSGAIYDLTEAGTILVQKDGKVGEFTKARIVGTEGHDLVALPI